MTSTETDTNKKAIERENLGNIINQWNANRLDLFEISQPNQDLEFHGVMRFYFQDAGQKVATKCIRVSSTASSRDAIHILIEKFRPDIRMLSVPEYALYEIHENGEERKLADDEKPLLVQLNWHKDDREGRFLLRRMDEKTYFAGFDPVGNNFKRKLSKREKKEKKKREKKERQKKSDKNKDGIAERLYTELPETSFTRSISNPEAVMRRRRQQKLEKKLQQLCQEGGPEAGGTLRIFGESLNKDVPYKTLLLSTRDTAAFVVREILEKYGRDKEEAPHYCLVQLIVPYNGGDVNAFNDFHSSTSGIREYILDDDDCPLTVEKQHNKSRGTLTFHIKRRPADYQPRKRKKKPNQIKGELDAGFNKYEETVEQLPRQLEVNPNGDDMPAIPKKPHLYSNVNDAGSSERSSEPSTPVIVASPASFDDQIMNNQVPPPPASTYSAGSRNSAQHFYEPEVATIVLHKSNNGMGLSIVAARGIGQDRLGIYVKSVVKSGAADMDGRLKAGDQLLKVNGQPLSGISQEKAAEIMTKTGSVVTLEVAKQAAVYHGLATLLSQPSPLITRGYPQHPRRMSERDIPSRINNEHPMRNHVNHVNHVNEFHPHIQPPRIQGSKSVPSLNNGPDGYPYQPSNHPAPHHQHPMYPQHQHVHNGQPIVYNKNNIPSRPNNVPMHTLLQPIRPNSQMSVQSQPIQGRVSSQASIKEEEERHYQNISMYQLNPSYSYQGQVQNSPRPSPNPNPVPNTNFNTMNHHSMNRNQVNHHAMNQNQANHHPVNQNQVNHHPMNQNQVNDAAMNQMKWARRYPSNTQQRQVEEQEERLRRLRLEEVERHHELQLAQQQEEELLREAKRRQDEEFRYQRKSLPIVNRLDLSNVNHDIPPPLPKSPPPAETNAHQRLDRLLLTNNASRIEQQNLAMRLNQPSAMRNGENMKPNSKKVSWDDHSVEVEAQEFESSSNHSSEANGQKNSHTLTLQDIDEVLGTPIDPDLSLTFQSHNTPNVIGAQEIYKDPRERIKLEKMKSQPQKHVVPEKLSFKDKIKMFAMESGERPDSAIDKLKISKAQREIETTFNGPDGEDEIDDNDDE